MINIFDAQFASKNGEQQLQSIIREEVNGASQSAVERFNILDTISTTLGNVTPEYRQEALHHIVSCYPDEVSQRQHFKTSEGCEVNVQMIDNYDYSDDLAWLKLNLAVKKIDDPLKAKKKELKGREEALRSLGKATYIDTTMRLQIFRR